MRLAVRAFIVIGSVTAVLAACGLGDDDKKTLKPSPGFDYTGDVDAASTFKGGTCPDIPAFRRTGCEACMKDKCQARCEVCANENACKLGLDCVKGCVGSASKTCVNDCIDATGGQVQTKLLDVIGDDGCIFDECGASCSGTKRVGDPCSKDSECPGECTQFCVRTCETDKDCGPASDRRLTRCVWERLNRYVCYPSCTDNDDCIEYGSSYRCLEVNPGPPTDDAGTDVPTARVCTAPG